ncbi:Uncharacterised protein [Mycobacteroides abscessus]|nr:Uncharacterised protein [Mycobacteroides abscessus]
MSSSMAVFHWACQAAWLIEVSPCQAACREACWAARSAPSAVSTPE